MRAKRLVAILAVMLAFMMLGATALAAAEVGENGTNDELTECVPLTGTKTWEGGAEHPGNDNLQFTIDGQPYTGEVDWDENGNFTLYVCPGDNPPELGEKPVDGYTTTVTGGTPVMGPGSDFEVINNSILGKKSFDLKKDLDDPDYIVINKVGDKYVIWTKDDKVLSQEEQEDFIKAFNEAAKEHNEEAWNSFDLLDIFHGDIDDGEVLDWLDGNEDINKQTKYANVQIKDGKISFKGAYFWSQFAYGKYKIIAYEGYAIVNEYVGGDGTPDTSEPETITYIIPLSPGAQRIPLGAPRTGGAGLGLIYGLVSMLGLAGAFFIKAKKR